MTADEEKDIRLIAERLVDATFETLEHMFLCECCDEDGHQKHDCLIDLKGKVLETIQRAKVELG